MSDETTLLPCPLCGGEAHVVSDYSSEHDETRWSLWHECCEHDGESAGYGHALFPWFETPWYKTEAEAIAVWNTRAYLNPDGLPMGLTISDDGNLLNWRGENYVKQGTLGEQPAKSGADALSRRARDMARNIQGNLGRCLYRRKDVAEMEEVSETLMELADELNAKLGSGTCEVVKGDGEKAGWWVCKSCGCAFDMIGALACNASKKPRFCPNCCAKVVG